MADPESTDSLRGHWRAQYPPWCLSFFVFAILQGIFALIPLAIVAYFIALEREHNAGSDVAESYRVLVGTSCITVLIIILSTATVAIKFRDAGSDKGAVELAAEELEEQADLLLQRLECETRNITDNSTIEIDVAVSGERWPLAFVGSQIVMAIVWTVLFVYVMSLTGGLSTSCSIRDPASVCKDLDICTSYETACRLVNLIVISCALDA
ncbi:uncharacterized protein V2V93DRAFT_320722 [Kockiozyma suomiensis]|uniref:uncharacterized protein n=1 Tax=Kockiozyma suomiensis TaxID=1337062 RepID=UPI00334416E9